MRLQNLILKTCGLLALAAFSVPYGKADVFGTLIFNDWVNPKAVPTISTTGSLTQSSSPAFWLSNGGCSGGSFEYCADILELQFGAGYTFEKVVWMTDSGPITWQPPTGAPQTKYTMDPGTGLASDSLEIAPSGARVLDLFFRSYDPSLPTCASVGGCALTEIPDSQQVIAEIFALNSSTNDEVQVNIAIDSDYVPEPASIFLLGTVATLAGLIVHRKARVV